ncbi:nitroreductase [Bacillus mesophilus]|uniref:Nitroreductase family protein n=1 Tax=Bacillus mesophilus TaxID=1808955 RepID=A0A6M0Q2X9_9BACI|nr:nitroreductase family protein [Bacillus mesophilus]MBM7659244.1 nitroreductase [Bacillus mesophilus]NEY70119.1 nitroreductase family protein [Bacillus mesophilus]
MTTDTIERTLTVKEAIESRHSIREFVQESIPPEDLNEIFELVRLSPSAWNLQPWRFHLVTDKTMKEKLQEAAYGQRQVTSAPAVVIVVSDMEDVLRNLPKIVHPGLSEERKQEEVANLSSFFGGMSLEERGQWGLTQTNIALGFLLTAIQGLGYSSVPMLGFDQQKVKELLDLPDHIKFAAMVPFGRPNSEGYEHHRLDLKKILTFH